VHYIVMHKGALSSIFSLVMRHGHFHNENLL
jgi:hypothetical protein